MKQGFNRSCCLLQLFFLECFMYIYIYISISLSSHQSSLFLQFTSFESSLFSFFALRVADRVQSENAGPRVNGRSRACFLVSISILLCVSIKCDGQFRVDSGVRSCIFFALPKECKVVRSSPRPRCLGEL